LTENKVKI